MPLLEFTDYGIYCPQGDFYIDPWKPVSRAVITHAHSDHARWGMQHYLAHRLSREVLKLRLGSAISLQTLDYEESVVINGVQVSLHSAGHCLGSAQVRVAYMGEVWVVSGDYKVEDDGISGPFQPVPCHSFITECTFGMPVFKWMPQAESMNEINAWWAQNQGDNKASVLFAYSLGKAQRLLANLNLEIGPVFVHGAIANTNEALKINGVQLPETTLVSDQTDRSWFGKSLIIAPPSAAGSLWLNRFGPQSTAMCSGWMVLRGNKRRNALDRGFVLSDHADWPGLLDAVAATGAEKVYATHGYTATFSRFLQEQGIQAFEVETLFGAAEDGPETSPSDSTEIPDPALVQ